MKTDTLTERTQGEWEVCGYHTPDRLVKFFPESEGANYMVTIRKKQGKLIGKVVGFISKREEAEANAAFICKAVNNYDSLLNALKNMVEIVSDSNSTEWKNYWNSDKMEETLNNVSKNTLRYFEAKEAIKKAEQ